MKWRRERHFIVCVIENERKNAKSAQFISFSPFLMHQEKDGEKKFIQISFLLLGLRLLLPKGNGNFFFLFSKIIIIIASNRFNFEISLSKRRRRWEDDLRRSRRIRRRGRRMRNISLSYSYSIPQQEGGNKTLPPAAKTYFRNVSPFTPLCVCYCYILIHWYWYDWKYSPLSLLAFGFGSGKLCVWSTAILALDRRLAPFTSSSSSSCKEFSLRRSLSFSPFRLKQEKD